MSNMYYECESWWWLDAEILTKEEIGCVLCYTYMYYILYYYHRERYMVKRMREGKKILFPEKLIRHSFYIYFHSHKSFSTFRVIKFR